MLFAICGELMHWGSQCERDLLIVFFQWSAINPKKCFRWKNYRNLITPRSSASSSSSIFYVHDRASWVLGQKSLLRQKGHSREPCYKGANLGYLRDVINLLRYFEFWQTVRPHITLIEAKDEENSKGKRFIVNLLWSRDDILLLKT